MIMDKIIDMKHVYKKYTLYPSMKARFFDLMTPKSYGRDFYALEDVAFSAESGDIVGFVGINGSGKSTLSNIIAGIVPETSGDIAINGNAALIAVNSGLKGDLTGRENIELKCLMLGFSMQEIRALEPDIIEFSELEEFIDQPVKSYSSGMKSRLGFAISVNIDPDILLIDEALSVGDKAFAEKSLNKMHAFKEQGKTMIFVSHSLSQMREFCDQILWLEWGRVKEYGSVDEVLPQYEAFLDLWKKLPKGERQAYKRDVLSGRAGDLPTWIAEESDLKPTALFKEVPVSRIGHIKETARELYADPSDEASAFAADEHRERVYFSKRRVDMLGESYYQLSTERSGVRGVVGWIRKQDFNSRQHTLIDEDPKQFKVKDSVFGHEEPWGGQKNRVISDADSLSTRQFAVERTERVGKKLWFYGLVDGKAMWIHNKHLGEIETED
ncbi:Teichoic acids export ATP-binding protein TagH [Lentibacillus sp. JNUCC-1]|uniref:teichoic acids export ABC transporter ATP-binding subunit TagH n=1 Tax=Lentibacillus sp. JNUCC-1 TaxID=2654513 RepID=UPI001322C987|nr:Teichoic acids export ATP-binding protein TagH [Lentibacillus sp. JNUCC-1]